MATTPVPGQHEYHDFHAEAHLLFGELDHPVKQKIEKHTHVALKDRKGGHLTRFTEDVNLEGLITFKRGNTRVSGSMSTKNDPTNHGWITLATSVLERLNILEVVTADRLVSQVSTDHPLEKGNFPTVTFLGSQFDNIRVNGVPLTLKLNLQICGDRPKGDTSYLSDRAFLERAKAQIEKLQDAQGLSDEVRLDYRRRVDDINKLQKGSREGNPKITCSIVTNIDNLDRIPIPGVRAVGHVLIIPNYGSVALGEVEVSERLEKGYDHPGNYFELKMIRAHLGCIGGGLVDGAVAAANGNTGPPKK